MESFPGELCARTLPFLPNPVVPHLGITDPRGLWDDCGGSPNPHVHMCTKQCL